MVYDGQLTEVKNLLPTAKNILIALPVGADIDKLAAGLSLYLSLKAQGREVSVVCEDSIRVGQSHLFAIDRVTNTLPQTGGGNLILSLEGIELVDGRPTALQNLDWYAEGQNTLNLVFHVVAGKSFQPTKITPKYQAGFDLIFVVGAANLNSLGGIYNQNSQAFNGHLVNIDNQGNTSFGTTNVVDPNASSVSEMVCSIMTNLGVNIDGDSATNLLNGIFGATANLTSSKVSADTFAAVATLLRLGGRKPEVLTPQQPTPTPGFDLSAFMPQQPASQQSTTPAANMEFTVPQVIQQSVPADGTVQQVVGSTPSTEERPVFEQAITESTEIEPDWLTPKVFKSTKGTTLG